MAPTRRRWRNSAIARSAARRKTQTEALVAAAKAAYAALELTDIHTIPMKCASARTAAGCVRTIPRMPDGFDQKGQRH